MRNFIEEYEKLCKWRSTWYLLYRKPDVILQSEHEYIERRIRRCNSRIKNLMSEFDAENTKKIDPDSVILNNSTRSQTDDLVLLIMKLGKEVIKHNKNSHIAIQAHDYLMCKNLTSHTRI